MFPSQTNQDGTHDQNLSLLCRVCGGVKFSHLSPSVKVKKEFVSKYIKKLYNVDVFSEDSSIYPEEVCKSCERKLKRFYVIVSKRKKCSFSKDSLALFIPHNDKLCLVCKSVEKHIILQENLSSETREPFISIVGEDAHRDENILRESYSDSPRRNPPRKHLLSVSKPSNLVSSQTQTENICIDEVDGCSFKWFKSVKVPPNCTWKYCHKQKGKVKSSYFCKLRFKPLRLLVDKFCHSQKLNKIEALFFLLIGALQETGDKIREVLIRDVWAKKNEIQCLSLEQCLAMRVLLKLNKETYKRQYSYFKEKLSKCVLKTPGHVDKHEKCFLPRSVDYHMSDASDAVVRNHSSSCSLGLLCKPHLTNVVHSRWLYSDVIAKTLQEFILLYKKDLSPDPSQLFKVIIKEHFEDKSPQCDGYVVPSPLPDCREGRNASTPHLTVGLKARLLTGYFTLVALQAANDLCSVKRLDERITGASRPFFRALYASENGYCASRARHDHQCANQKDLSLAMAEQIPYAPKYQCPCHRKCAAAAAAAVCKTLTYEPNSIAMLYKSGRSSLVSKASPEQHTRNACTPTSPLASQRHEPWLCPPPGAPQSVAVLLDVLHQERQELLGNVLHVVCPTSNTTYRFVVSFEAPRPEILKDYRNTRGLVRLHPCDEKSWLPRALGALSSATRALDSGACVREQGSVSAPQSPARSDPALRRGRMTSSGSQPPMLDMVRIFLASSLRLRAAGFLRTREQRNTDSASGAGRPPSKPGVCRPVQRSAPRPQVDRPLQRTEVLRPSEEFADNPDGREKFSALPTPVPGNTVLEQAASDGLYKSKAISKGDSKAEKYLEDQRHTHPPLQCSSEKEFVMSNLQCSPYNSHSLQQYSNNVGHNERQNIFINNHYRCEMENVDSSSESIGSKLKRASYLLSNRYPYSYSPPTVQLRPDEHGSAGNAAPNHHSDPLTYGDSTVMCYTHTKQLSMNAISISGAVDVHMDTTEAHPADQIANEMPRVPSSAHTSDTYSNNSATNNGIPSATAPSGSDELHHMTALKPVVNWPHNGNANLHDCSLLAASKAYADAATALDPTTVSRSSDVGYNKQVTSNFKEYEPPPHWH